jgi:hypothetical protein
MNTALLGKLFGSEQRWLGPCTIVLDADATVQTTGVDSIVGGGAKSYAPRLVSGRIAADSVCLVPGDASALVILQQQKTRGSSGEETVKQALIIADAAHVVAVEFPDMQPLTSLGLALPAR